MTARSLQERDELVLHGMPCVKREARRMARLLGNPDAFADLSSAGYLGLVTAARDYDAARGIPFTAYATLVVRGRILNEVRKQDAVPEKMRRALRDGIALVARRMNETGERLDSAAIDREVPGFQRARALAHERRAERLDARHPGMPDLCMHETVADRAGSAEERALRAFEVCALRDAVAALPRTRRAVIEAAYFEQRPMRDVAEQLGLSPQRISQLHLDALKKLRITLGDGA